MFFPGCRCCPQANPVTVSAALHGWPDPLVSVNLSGRAAALSDFAINNLSNGFLTEVLQINALVDPFFDVYPPRAFGSPRTLVYMWFVGERLIVRVSFVNLLFASSPIVQYEKLQSESLSSILDQGTVFLTPADVTFASPGISPGSIALSTAYTSGVFLPTQEDTISASAQPASESVAYLRNTRCDFSEVLFGYAGQDFEFSLGAAETLPLYDNTTLYQDIITGDDFIVKLNAISPDVLGSSRFYFAAYYKSKDVIWDSDTRSCVESESLSDYFYSGFDSVAMQLLGVAGELSATSTESSRWYADSPFFPITADPPVHTFTFSYSEVE